MLNKPSVPLTGIRALTHSMADKLFRQQTLTIAILALLLSQVVIGEGLRPFAIPFYVAMLTVSPIWATAGIVVGHVFVGFGNVFWLLLSLLPIYFIRIRAPTNSLVLILLAVGGQIIYNIPTLANTVLAYDWLLLAMELALTATGVLIFYQAGMALQQGPKGAEEGFEQSLSLVVTSVLALTSISGLYLGPFAVLTVLGAWLVLVVASVGGSGVGAGVGIVAGILTGFGHLYPATMVATLAMAGMLAGVFKNWGKAGTLLGFAAGIVTMLVFSGHAVAGLAISDVALAALLFVLTPKIVGEKLKSFWPHAKNEWAWEYQLRLRTTTTAKLQKLAAVFSRLSNSFGNSGVVQDMTGNHFEMSRIFDQLATSVCSECVNYRRCWERELYSTYSQLMDYLTGEEEFDCLLARRCPNIEELLEQAVTLYQQFASEQRWAAKVYECKDVVSEQLRGVSDVIGQLARQIRLDVDCRRDLEDGLVQRLQSWGVEVFDLSVRGTERNLPQVYIWAKVPAGENPLGVIQAMVNEAVGHNLQLVENAPAGEGHKLTFALPVKYKLKLGVAQMAKDEVNGDCFSHLQSSPEKHVYMLSDGMGKGNRARAESNQALTLARSMLETGFSAETVIKALNSLLVLRGKERFATLDIAVLDCTLGKMDIFKTGAVTSFVKSAGQVETISGAGLPIGIIPGIEPRLIQRNLKAGDYLVMVSDGVIDGQQRDEDWLVNQLENMGPIAAQTMARQLLNRATELGSSLQDDATVVVVQIREEKSQLMRAV